MKDFSCQVVATMCGVDRKTIANWAMQGKIPHYRTEGRHLRFHRTELVEFFRAYGWPVPDSLRIVRPRVVCTLSDALMREAIGDRMRGRFTWTERESWIELLVHWNDLVPEAIITGIRDAHVDVRSAVRELAARAETRHVLIVALTDDPAEARTMTDAGAVPLATDDVNGVAHAIEERLFAADPPKKVRVAK